MEEALGLGSPHCGRCLRCRLSRPPPPPAPRPQEMEAAAVAWSADLFGCPMFCLKSITDIVDGDRPAQEEFLENLHRAAAALQRVVPAVVEHIAGRRYSEL